MVYLAEDFALSGQSQFPSTGKKAQEVWTNYLNSKALEGWQFVSTFNYALGADLNRRMVIFQKEDAKKLTK